MDHGSPGQPTPRVTKLDELATKVLTTASTRVVVGFLNKLIRIHKATEDEVITVTSRNNLEEKWNKSMN